MNMEEERYFADDKVWKDDITNRIQDLNNCLKSKILLTDGKELKQSDLEDLKVINNGMKSLTEVIKSGLNTKSAAQMERKFSAVCDYLKDERIISVYYEECGTKRQTRQCCNVL